MKEEMGSATIITEKGRSGSVSVLGRRVLRKGSEGLRRKGRRSTVGPTETNPKLTHPEQRRSVVWDCNGKTRHFPFQILLGQLFCLND